MVGWGGGSGYIENNSLSVLAEYHQNNSYSWSSDTFQFVVLAIVRNTVFETDRLSST